MNNGVVKWFDSKKGYGFITSEDKDIFVHYSGIIADRFKSLTEGQNVSFDTVDSDKGEEHGRKQESEYRAFQEKDR